MTDDEYTKGYLNWCRDNPETQLFGIKEWSDPMIPKLDAWSKTQGVQPMATNPEPSPTTADCALDSAHDALDKIRQTLKLIEQLEIRVSRLELLLVARES